MPPEDLELFTRTAYALVGWLEEQQDEARDRLSFMLDWAMEQLSRSTEAAYKSGRKDALAGALYVSLTNGQPPPLWARQVFSTSVFDDPKSWDDVLGPPPRYRLREWSLAFDEGNRLHSEGYKKLDHKDAMFSELAKRLSDLDAEGKQISPGEAKRRYYRHHTNDLLSLRMRVGAGPLDAATKDQLTFIIDVINCLGSKNPQRRDPNLAKLLRS
jgi:hypothetical protein